MADGEHWRAATRSIGNRLQVGVTNCWHISSARRAQPTAAPSSKMTKTKTKKTTKAAATTTARGDQCDWRGAADEMAANALTANAIKRTTTTLQAGLTSSPAAIVPVVERNSCTSDGGGGGGGGGDQASSSWFPGKSRATRGVGQSRASEQQIVLRNEMSITTRAAMMTMRGISSSQRSDLELGKKRIGGERGGQRRHQAAARLGLQSGKVSLKTTTPTAAIDRENAEMGANISRNYVRNSGRSRKVSPVPKTVKRQPQQQPADPLQCKRNKSSKLFLVMMPSNNNNNNNRSKREFSSATRLAPWLWLTSGLLLGAAAVALTIAGGVRSEPLSDSSVGQDHSSVLHPNSDLLTVALPPFAPTRRPQASAGSGPPPSSSSSSHFDDDVDGGGRGLVAPKASVYHDDDGRTILHGSASVISGSNVPHNSYQTGAAGSSAKFSRTNELDSFLDEMNHNELQTVAAGKPIDDLFLPKASRQAPPRLIGQAQQQQQHHQQQQQQQSPHNQASPAGASDKSQLMGSHSEQQIYSECALILQRTYVKNIDDPKHQLVPFGKTEQACISYKHIDKAVEQAKHKLKFREFAKMRKKPLPSGSPMKPPVAPLDVIHSSLEPPEDLVAAIGEINMATTQIIADQFDLSNDELLNGLPLIDMSKTKFWDICPLFVKQDLKCEITRFRTFTGHCNNIKHPTWGAAKTPYARYLPPVHPDGIWVPRKSIVSEITFDVGIGHRETHANIAPSMPLPIIHSEHHGHQNFPSHHNIEDLASMHSPAAVAAPPLLPQPDHHRMGAASSIDELAKQADEELRERHLNDAHNHNVDDDMALAPSVQFVRRAPFGGHAAALELTGAHSLGVEAPMESLVPPTHAQPPPAMSLEASALHFQQQPGHLRNVMLPPPPPPPHQLGHLSHFHQQQHHQAAVAAAASNHQLPPMVVPHQAHKSRSIPQELPSARLVTSIVHRDMDVPNHDFTVLFMSWGQLLDHDMTRAAQPPTTIKCCPSANGEQPTKHKLCLPIQVPPNDPFYSKFNVQCLEFRRTLAGVRPNCVLGPRVHQNANTSPIDANFVYGSSQEMAEGLRLFKGGRLRDRDWFHREGLKPLLPAQEVDPDLSCLGRPKDLFCFLAGDVRVNEQTHLTVLHTLYMREHNRLADKLSELNPHWDDERIFQEARHIIAASVQHVLINEYIPLLIGRKMTELYNLTAQAHIPGGGNSGGHHLSHHHHQHHSRQPQYAFWHGYDPSVTTSVSNSFAAAAFRQGHTFVQSTIDRFNKFHEFVASEKLRHLFMQPFLLYQPGVMDELVSGLINKQSQSYDPFISEEISGHLFQPPEQEFGHDLAAINLQRGREQGLPGYNLFREWCGLPRAETFEQLEPYLTNHTAYQYSRIYKHVDDIDLWSGGISERKLPGSAIGPTFACIIARQFSNTRRGDRFWYENPGLPSSFTPDQLAEIRKVTLAKLLCANADDLPTIQRWAFRLAHPIMNPRVDCHSLPEIDFQYWQEE